MAGKTLTQVLGLTTGKAELDKLQKEKEFRKWIANVRSTKQEMLDHDLGKTIWPDVEQKLLAIEKDMANIILYYSEKERQNFQSRILTEAGRVSKTLSDDPPEILLKSAQEKEEVLKKKLDDLLERLVGYQEFAQGATLYDEKSVTLNRQIEIEKGRQTRIDQIELLKNRVLIITLENSQDLPAVEKAVKEIYKFKFDSELGDELQQKEIDADTLSSELQLLADQNKKNPYHWRQAEVNSLVESLNGHKQTLESNSKTPDEKELASSLARIGLWKLKNIVRPSKVPFDFPGKSSDCSLKLNSGIAKLKSLAGSVVTAFSGEKDAKEVTQKVTVAMEAAVRPLDGLSHALTATNNLYRSCPNGAGEALLNANMVKLPTLIKNCKAFIYSDNALKNWAGCNLSSFNGNEILELDKALTELEKIASA